MDNSTDIKKTRIYELVMIISEFMSAGAVIMLMTALTGHGIPCIFHMITGMKCPGCGMTRACVSMIHGDLRGAFHDNALSLTLIPALVIYFFYRGYRYITSGKTEFRRWELVFLSMSLTIAVIYGIVRNGTGILL